MPHRQKIAVRAKMLMRCREALKLTSEGLSQVDVATRMGVSTDSVKRYVQRALLTESMFPSSLTPEKVAELRLLQAEVLANSRRMALETQATVNGRVGTPTEKSGDAQACARLLEAVTRAVELESDLFGTKQPTRVIEEQTRLQVNLTRVGDKPMLTWDRSILTKPVGPVPGLTIYEGCRNNGNTEQPKLPDTASN